eukprot:11629373-Ditylum_brightwellii.AAC.1
MATAKGHMAHNKKNVRSTTKKSTLQTDDEKEDFWHQQQPVKTNMVYLVLKLAEKFDHTNYTDLTGKFPVTSQASNKYVIVAYDYDSNSIIAVPVPNHSGSTLTKAIDYIYTYLTDWGFKPALNVMDNEASAAIKRCIKSNGAKLQLVELHNHCVNAAKHAVHTFKEHFIAGLCITDKDFHI